MSSRLITIATSVAILLFPLGQLGRLGWIPGSAYSYAYEIPLIIAVLLMLLAYGRKPFTSVFSKGFALPVIIFLSYAGFSLIVSSFRYGYFENIIAGLYLARLSLYFLFVVYIAYASVKGLISRSWLTGGIIYIALVSVGAAVIQYLWYPDLRNLYYAGWDPHYFRVFGLYFEPVIAAIVFGLLSLRLVTLEHVVSLKSRIGTYTLAAVCIVLFVGTFSRGAYLGIIAAAGTLAMRRMNAKTVGLISLIAIFSVAILWIIPKPSGEGVNLLRTSTIASRVEDYKEGIRVWQQFPVFGIGYNHIRAEKDIRTSPDLVTGEEVPNNAAGSFHSTFLIVLATTGVVGFLLFLNMLYGLIVYSSSNRYALMAMVFLTVASIFDNILLHPFVLFLLGITWAVGLHASDTHVTDRELYVDEG